MPKSDAVSCRMVTEPAGADRIDRNLTFLPIIRILLLSTIAPGTGTIPPGTGTCTPAARISLQQRIQSSHRAVHSVCGIY